MIHDKLLHEFSALVLKSDRVVYRKIKNQEYLRMTLVLKDGSSLEIREFYDTGKLVAYSYYWLTADKKLIIGWDNAPHHRELTTYPHHKHVEDQSTIAESREHNLEQVLGFIRKKLV